jgi:hypothetical protein
MPVSSTAVFRDFRRQQAKTYVVTEPCVDVLDWSCIEYEEDVPEQWWAFVAADADFFSDLGSPGGASNAELLPRTDVEWSATSP